MATPGGGAVITEAGNEPSVKSLVYIAAFAPDAGQSTAALADTFPAAPGSASIASTRDGYLYLPEHAIGQNFAPDVPRATQQQIAATQGPVRAAAFADKVSRPAWKTKPSWYLVSSEDRMINPNLERAMATTIHATREEVSASHVSMVSHPGSVVHIISEAAAAAH